jgi:hypothetical protein
MPMFGDDNSGKGVGNMLPLVTSQALALAHAKRNASKRRAAERVAHDKRKPLLSRVFDALAASRMRRAEIEVAHYRRMREET